MIVIMAGQRLIKANLFVVLNALALKAQQRQEALADVQAIAFLAAFS